jgi:bis(5'-nucleosyl)-tetraphosphatase (symmetrical)
MPLERLLEKIQFDAIKDTLWFTGDLVNRGPQSLGALRYVKNLGNKHKVVLGNHDLHLLARSFGTHAGSADDTLEDILQAPDREELFTWLRQLPLIHHDANLGYTLVHAGLAPAWSLTQALQLGQEVTNIIQSNHALSFFQHMYGNTPNQWNDNLQGFDRLRCITNYFTRLRFCYPDGAMELKNKGTLASASQELIPWFQVKSRVNTQIKIVFGHWAALSGITHTPNVYALDTGCVWGYCLTAMRLEDEERFHVSCSN